MFSRFKAYTIPQNTIVIESTYVILWHYDWWRHGKRGGVALRLLRRTRSHDEAIGRLGAVGYCSALRGGLRTEQTGGGKRVLRPAHGWGKHSIWMVKTQPEH